MLARIKSIKKINRPQKRYDIQVSRTHNFFANDILVHNCSLYQGKVYARSTGLPTTCPSFDYIKANHAWKSLNWSKRIASYGENMYALHSIPYDALDDFYYVFGVKESIMSEAFAEYCLLHGLKIPEERIIDCPELNEWFSWEELQLFCMEYDLNHVPSVAENIIFKTEKELSSFLVDEIKKPSHFGSEREGFVIRNADRFRDDKFSTNVCKYVRANHVTTSEHWSKTWVPNKLRV